jgi:hypothetical protein
VTQPATDWDAAYRQEAPPPWSIGRPQPELAALLDQGEVRGDVLDAGATAVSAAAQGLTTATFAQADVTSFGDYPPGSEGGFTEIELRAVVSTLWEADDIRPAKVYGNDSALAAAGLVNLDHDSAATSWCPASCCAPTSPGHDIAAGGST